MYAKIKVQTDKERLDKWEKKRKEAEDKWGESKQE